MAKLTPQTTKNRESISLIKLRQNPLGFDDIGLAVLRRQPLERILHNVLFYDGGCYLLSGQRGSGKTTLVNLLTYYLEHMELPEVREILEQRFGLSAELVPDRLSVLTVKIDIVKGYDEVGLLEKVLREITTRLLEIYQLDSRASAEIRRRLGPDLTQILVAYINDCRELLDYRKSASLGRSDDRSTSLGIEITGRFQAELNALVAKDQGAIELAPHISREVARAIQRNISLEARDYSIERLESRLSKLLRALSLSSSVTSIYAENLSTLLSYTEIDELIRSALDQPGLLSKARDSLDKLSATVKVAWEKVVSRFQGIEAAVSRRVFDKVVIVIDDTDKAGYDEAVRVLNSLRSLFQTSQAFFLLVGSEEFYEEWYSYSAPGTRSSIDSVFHNIYYLPPLSVNEAQGMLELLTTERESLTEKQKNLLEWYAQVLLFISQGLPRQMIRSLDLLSKKALGNYLILDGDFFNVFKAPGYPDLIRRFLDVYTGYRDPRYEKCLYIALMMLSSVRTVTSTQLHAMLESNSLTKFYSPVIRKQILEDVARILSSNSGVSSPVFVVNTPAAAFLARIAKDTVQSSIASYLVEASGEGDRHISEQKIRNVLSLHNVAGGTVDGILTFLESHDIIHREEATTETLIESSEYPFVIGPREIEGINVGSLTLNQIVQERRTGDRIWATSPKVFRRFLAENAS